MLSKKCINSLAKEVKKINNENKNYNSSELSKASIKDLEKLIICVGLGNYEDMKETRLYNNLSSAYCIALEIISNFNLIETESIYQYENKYYYRIEVEKVLSGENLQRYYVNKAYSYIFNVIKIDNDLKKAIDQLVDKMESVFYKKESNLFYNRVIKDIREELKMENNKFYKKVENITNKKVTKKQIEKIVNSITYTL